LHLVDATSETIEEDYAVVVHELEAYGAGLAEKPRILALNKIDALDAEETEAAASRLEAASGMRVFRISGVTGAGIPPVLRTLRAAIEGTRKTEAVRAMEPGPWRP
jgi:GTP-binding protein